MEQPAMHSKPRPQQPRPPRPPRAQRQVPLELTPEPTSRFIPEEERQAIEEAYGKDVPCYAATARKYGDVLNNVGRQA